jgi:rhodanese-related sulfurtransferase/DNA-binding HxlR family transcriptional regulator
LIVKTSIDILIIVAKRVAKNALFDGFARAARALGNGHRLEIVDVLAQGERSVDELATEIDESTANTSQHLQVLARAGLVRSQRDGTRVVYRLAADDVAALWTSLRGVASRHLAEVEVLAADYLGERGEVEQVDAEELATRLERGDVVVLDVRPASEYRAGHIAAARSAPIAELAEIAAGLPKRAEVVAYCRGPYCVYADDAVRLLRSRGLRARRLDVGYPEWQRAGLPTARAG